MDELELALLDHQICFKSSISNSNSTDKYSLVHAPITITPTPFSSVAFHRALKLQPAFNILILRTVQNGPLLREVCAKLAEGDEFVAKLYEIYLKYPITPKLFFSVNRSDYMVESDDRIYQIELNTISASLAGLSTKLTELQKERFPDKNIPNNAACYRIAKSFNQAIDLYTKEYSLSLSLSLSQQSTPAILFIIQDNERNYFDQLHLQNSIDPKIPILRRDLSDPSIFSVNSQGILFVENYEIGLIYYRAGYSPDEYKNPKYWISRELLESCRAIKCPDIASHLAGLKKIQQVLTVPSKLLETLQGDEILANELKSSFAGIYSLDDDELGQSNTLMALSQSDPNRFVLKPQREGGGNNFYGPQVISELLSMSPSQRSTFILMDRIHPLTFETSILRNSSIESIRGVGELGVYGTILTRGDEIVLNEQVGWLLRTKPEESDEGGVVTGYSVLDVPCLKIK